MNAQLPTIPAFLLRNIAVEVPMLFDCASIDYMPPREPVQAEILSAAVRAGLLVPFPSHGEHTYGMVRASLDSLTLFVALLTRGSKP